MRRHDRSRGPRPQNKNPHEAGFELFERSVLSVRSGSPILFWFFNPYRSLFRFLGRRVGFPSVSCVATGTPTPTGHYAKDI
jgi:hypothetical protein